MGQLRSVDRMLSLEEEQGPMSRVTTTESLVPHWSDITSMARFESAAADPRVPRAHGRMQGINLSCAITMQAACKIYCLKHRLHWPIASDNMKKDDSAYVVVG